MDIPFDNINWINNLRFDKGHELALITDVGEFRDCTMELNRKYYAILDFGKMKRGWIQYNIKEDKDLFKKQSIVTRRKSSKYWDRLDVKKYYILVIRPTSVDSKYKKIRVGLI